MAYVVPCVRFNDVVRSLTAEILCLAPGRHSLKSLSSLLQRQDFLLRRFHLKPVLVFSFIIVTLGTNGWLDLVRQGLSPCKKRQALLGALTVSVSRKWAERGLRWGAGENSKPETGLKNAQNPTCRLHALLASCRQISTLPLNSISCLRSIQFNDYKHLLNISFNC